MIASLSAIILSLAPYSGPALNAEVPGATKFSVSVKGNAGESVRLRAVGVPAGYIASFCTARVCAPFAVTVKLPASGTESIELQLIENIDGAKKPKRVTVTANGGHAATIAFLRGRASTAKGM